MKSLKELMDKGCCFILAFVLKWEEIEERREITFQQYKELWEENFFAGRKKKELWKSLKNSAENFNDWSWIWSTAVRYAPQEQEKLLQVFISKAEKFEDWLCLWQEVGKHGSCKKTKLKDFLWEELNSRVISVEQLFAVWQSSHFYVSGNKKIWDELKEKVATFEQARWVFENIFLCDEKEHFEFLRITISKAETLEQIKYAWNQCYIFEKKREEEYEANAKFLLRKAFSKVETVDDLRVFLLYFFSSSVCTETDKKIFWEATKPLGKSFTDWRIIWHSLCGKEIVFKEEAWKKMKSTAKTFLEWQELWLLATVAEKEEILAILEIKAMKL